VENYQKH